MTLFSRDWNTQRLEWLPFRSKKSINSATNSILLCRSRLMAGGSGFQGRAWIVLARKKKRDWRSV